MTDRTVNRGRFLQSAALFLAGSLLAAPLFARGEPVPADAFPELAGWTKAGPVQIYQPRTLYDYINGAAESYLAYDFQELSVMEYKGGGRGFLTAEVYRMKDPRMAFGIYSQERPAGGAVLNAGAGGYLEGDGSAFLSGPHYVKLTALEAGEPWKALEALALGIARRLGGTGSLPPQLNAFPVRGRAAGSERFAARNALGHAFLHDAFTVEYAAGAKLVLVEGRDTADAGRMLEAWSDKAGGNPAGMKEGPFSLKDPYLGEVRGIWTGRCLLAVLNATGPDSTRLLEQLEAAAKNLPAGP